MTKERVVSVFGLGYVGLPVAVEFAKKYRTIGFDLNPRRIEELKNGVDRNKEISASMLKLPGLTLTHEIQAVAAANFHIVAVPTPIDDAKQPNLQPLVIASELVGQILKKGDIVVYESTVYPGVTEEECLPILEKASGLKGGEDFTVGYSPERIVPGDTERTFAHIKKIVSGQDEATLGIVADMYGSVVVAGVHRAPSIRVAEAAKVIENTQRDLNIALMNELAMIFDQMNIDTHAVLEAAGTKWNFLKFFPGLVGGHCIGVDPYYLTHKAEKMAYTPQVILAGRRINNSMGKFIAQKTIREMIRAGHSPATGHVTIMGLAFKENCGDIRNSRVIDIYTELKDYGIRVNVCDPQALPDETEREYGITLRTVKDLPQSDAVIFAVAHDEFKQLGADELSKLLKPKGVLIDVKGIYSADCVPDAIYWRL